jgi:type I restriction-modification system DNA methylase subunit
MSSAEQLNKLFRDLDMNKENGLVSEDADDLTAYQKHFYNSVKEKLKVSAVYFLRSNGESPRIPLIYFTSIESYDAKKIAQLHRLAWNLGEAPLLFIVTPEQLLIYNNYEIPKYDNNELNAEAVLIEKISLITELENERQQLMQYHRTNLESGKYWRDNNTRFKIENRVDSVLTKNLKIMRDNFLEKINSVPIVHSLIGRAILIKYLEDKKDSQGNSAFPDGFFAEYHPTAISFTDVLSSNEATYKMFDFFQKKFNGDMFPLTDLEKSVVGEKELSLLKDFLIGNIDLASNQYNFWPLYTFNVIPIQLISTIYEMFFQLAADENSKKGRKTSRSGTYYTPYHLVEMLMDEVLPWDGEYCQTRILDPSCGSGAFLVEAYRRIVARWMHSNKVNHIHPEKLKDLLSKHIFGVDRDEEAIRIASFSLCLVLCDYLEPLSIWNELQFPNLHEGNLYACDFFDKKSDFNNNKYDLIIGNPPWESKLSDFASNYLKETQHPVGDNQISQAFTWKAAELCKDDGNVCLLMPSKGFLFNRSTTNTNYRKTFFVENNVLTIINFSGFRAQLFKNAKSPATAVYFKPKSKDMEEYIFYCTPKPTFTIEDRRQFLIEPLDICRIPKDIINNEYIWKIAMYGGPRDLELIEKLTDQFETLNDYAQDNDLIIAEGYKAGNQSKEYLDFKDLKNVRPQDMTLFSIDQEKLFDNNRTKFERIAVKNLGIFRAPHLLIKQSPKNGRLITALLEYDAIFGHSILGVAGNETILKYLSLLLSSKVFAYFALMTSRRWIIERSELEAGEIKAFPIPKPNENLLREANRLYALSTVIAKNEFNKKLDEYIYKAFELTIYEQYLIDDAMEYILGYNIPKSRSNTVANCSQGILQKYAEILTNVLENTFGNNKTFSFEVFHGKMPLAVAHIILNRGQQNIKIKESDNIRLRCLLNELDQLLVDKHSQGLYVRRNVIIYEKESIYIVKPNQKRYWTYSAACRDADDIYAQIMRTWRQSK